MAHARVDKVRPLQIGKFRHVGIFKVAMNLYTLVNALGSKRGQPESQPLRLCNPEYKPYAAPAFLRRVAVPFAAALCLFSKAAVRSIS